MLYTIESIALFCLFCLPPPPFFFSFFLFFPPLGPFPQTMRVLVCRPASTMVCCVCVCVCVFKIRTSQHPANGLARPLFFFFQCAILQPKKAFTVFSFLSSCDATSLVMWVQMTGNVDGDAGQCLPTEPCLPRVHHVKSACMDRANFPPPLTHCVLTPRPFCIC